MVYTDGIHLITDGPIEELHEFAESIGLKRKWFQNHRHPHYDLTSINKLHLAYKKGAFVISDRLIVKIQGGTHGT